MTSSLTDEQLLQARNEFPSFKDGDTLLTISHDHRYVVHSSVLRGHSSLFNDLLAPEGPTLTKRAVAKGTTVRYRLALRPQGDNHRFVRIELDADGRVKNGLALELENDNGKIPSESFKYYDTLLRAFYNIDPETEDITIATILRDGMGVLDVAEYLGSVALIAKTYASALVARGQETLAGIAQNPFAWINLGYRLSSRYIFKEALIHLVGRYNEFAKRYFHPDSKYPYSVIDTLRPEIRTIVEEKLLVLRKMGVDTDVKMMAHYPLNLMKEAVTGRADRDSIGRAAYANDILSWLALSLYKHWYGLMMSHDFTHGASDFGCDFYRRVSRGEAKFLDRDLITSFHKRFPMSGKGQDVMENHLLGVKEGVRMHVDVILKHYSELDVKEKPVSWLTCTEVRTEDFPWVRAAKAKKRALAEAEEDDEGEDSPLEEGEIPTKRRRRVEESE